MNKTIDDINNEIKSIINESKFISLKLRNRIIKMLGNEFDINLPLENYENIDDSFSDVQNRKIPQFPYRIDMSKNFRNND